MNPIEMHPPEPTAPLSEVTGHLEITTFGGTGDIKKIIDIMSDAPVSTKKTPPSLLEKQLFEKMGVSEDTVKAFLTAGKK